MKRSLILWTTVWVFFFVGSALAVDFNHVEHQAILDEDPACFYCHKQDAKMIIPAKDACLECHEEDFYAQISFAGIIIFASCLWQ